MLGRFVRQGLGRTLLSPGSIHLDTVISRDSQGTHRSHLTLSRTLNPIAYSDRLIIPEILHSLLPLPLVGIILKVRHYHSTWEVDVLNSTKFQGSREP